MQKQSIPINIVVNNSVLSALSKDGRWQETWHKKQIFFEGTRCVYQILTLDGCSETAQFGFEMFICQIQSAFAK